MEGKIVSNLKEQSFHRTLLKVAFPIIIQNFIVSSLNMIDTMMIGKLGEIEIASVGIANQYFFLFNLIIMGVFSGCGIFVSQFWGRKDIKNIRKMLGIGLVSGGSIAVIFTLVAAIFPKQIIGIFNTNPQVIELGSQYIRVVCLSYIFTAITFNFAFASRCIEHAVLPMIVSSFALLSNVFFNYIFIFGHFGAKPMGVKGAALATVIARVFECIILIVYIYLSKGVLAAKFNEMLNFGKEFGIKVFKTVSSVVLNEACWGLGFVIYSVAYGRIGAKAMASIQICNTVQNLFMVIIFGIANASVVMIGNKIGANCEEEAKQYGKKLIKLACVIALGLASMLYLNSKRILQFFNISNEVYHDSLIILYIMSLIMLVRVFNITTIVGILRGGGDTKYALKLEAITMWCIGVPISFIGAFLFKLPVYVVYALVTIEEVIKAITALRRFISNKWVKNVISDI
ncbi:MATE family efflux transporter [Clostridium sp. MB40-C1]|uniref:MATE family efflux transporter n=1 Tax=Clostridium sp. MB40-C1 TaxID=3070996 RepID=UPI0027E0FEC3|nr:MATE family efflux transporter [Clostridium sp. MB40-C1]WMJ79097.1 MATE family efflux transporter [Clostridium sp. MB40-C1]